MGKGKYDGRQVMTNDGYNPEWTLNEHNEQIQKILKSLEEENKTVHYSEPHSTHKMRKQLKKKLGVK